MLFRALLFTKHAFTTFSNKGNINRSIKSSKSLPQIIKVFKTQSPHFDSVHHLFFLQKYLSFSHLIDPCLTSSLQYFEENINSINDRTFCHLFYLVAAFKLDLDWEILKKEVTSRQKRFTIENINLILLALRKSQSDKEDKKGLGQILIKNVNIAKATSGEELVNLFQNFNELGCVSVSLNKGILGKLQLMEDWKKLKNYNIIIKTILHANLDQNIAAFEKDMCEIVKQSTDLRSLVILLMALSKFHKPSMTVINTALGRTKRLSMQKIKEYSQQQQQTDGQQQQQSQTKQSSNKNPIQAQNSPTLSQTPPSQELKPIDVCHIIHVMNKLSLFDNDLFELIEEIFWKNITTLSQEDCILFLNGHRIFCLRLIQKISVENTDYNRKLNSIKQYYNSFYQKLFTFLRTRPSVSLELIYEVLKVSQGIYFTKNSTRQMAIVMVKERVLGRKTQLTEKEKEVLKGVIGILETYKRLPEVLKQIKRVCQKGGNEQIQ